MGAPRSPDDNGNRWNDGMASAAAPTRAEPMAEHIRSHPEMSSSPAMSGLPGRATNPTRPSLTTDLHPATGFPPTTTVATAPIVKIRATSGMLLSHACRRQQQQGSCSDLDDGRGAARGGAGRRGARGGAARGSLSGVGIRLRGGRGAVAGAAGRPVDGHQIFQVAAGGHPGDAGQPAATSVADSPAGRRPAGGRRVPD